MPAPSTTAPGNNFGFLTILQEPTGTLGGYLVTNLWGRPLEFRLTSAVQPNRVQHILYGNTLNQYLCGELIGKTLVDKSTIPAAWIITDHPAALELRMRVGVPVSLYVPGGPPPTLPGDPQGRGLYGHERYPDDGALVHDFLAKLGVNFDLGEPFQRIRDAIHEARKMGVGKSQAA
jgi:hypothetical protein